MRILDIVCKLAAIQPEAHVFIMLLPNGVSQCQIRLEKIGPRRWGAGQLMCLAFTCSVRHIHCAEARDASECYISSGTLRCSGLHFKLGEKNACLMVQYPDSFCAQVELAEEDGCPL